MCPICPSPLFRAHPASDAPNFLPECSMSRACMILPRLSLRRESALAHPLRVLLLQIRGCGHEIEASGSANGRHPDDELVSCPLARATGPHRRARSNPSDACSALCMRAFSHLPSLSCAPLVLSALLAFEGELRALSLELENDQGIYLRVLNALRKMMS
jgi:hypothetical protein